MAYVGQKAIGDPPRQHMFDHVQQMSTLDFFQRVVDRKKWIARFTNDLTALQQVIARAPIYCAMRDGLTAIFNIGLVFYLNWRFALLIVALLRSRYSAIIIGSLGKRCGASDAKARNRWAIYTRSSKRTSRPPPS